mgnify:CR=1 FL=1
MTVSFRIPKKLKKEMDRLRGLVNWSEEIRRFIERRVRELEQLRVIEELECMIESIKVMPKGTAVKYVREDHGNY